MKKILFLLIIVSAFATCKKADQPRTYPPDPGYYNRDTISGPSFGYMTFKADSAIGGNGITQYYTKDTISIVVTVTSGIYGLLQYGVSVTTPHYKSVYTRPTQITATESNLYGSYNVWLTNRTRVHQDSIHLIGYNIKQ